MLKLFQLEILFGPLGQSFSSLAVDLAVSFHWFALWWSRRRDFVADCGSTYLTMNSIRSNTILNQSYFTRPGSDKLTDYWRKLSIKEIGLNSSLLIGYYLGIFYFWICFWMIVLLRLDDIGISIFSPITKFPRFWPEDLLTLIFTVYIANLWLVSGSPFCAMGRLWIYRVGFPSSFSPLWEAQCLWGIWQGLWLFCACSLLHLCMW
jgi:hypothetical protein